MKTPLNIGCVKRTYKDYSLSFKLQVVDEIESGQLDRLNAHLKYGTFDWENLAVITVVKTPKQKILELEAKVKLLEKQKARAEHLMERADKKVIIFDMLVDMAEKEYDIQIRKNYTPELSKLSKKNIKKR